MLKKYVKGLLSPLPELLRKAEKDFDENAIHKIRVTIKKLRALASFLKFADPALPLKEDLRAVRILFRAAGQLRDIQVREKLQKDLGLTDKKALNAFFEEQHKQKKEARKNLKTQLAVFGEAEVKTLHHVLKEHLSGFPTSQIEEMARDYLHTLRHSIQGDIARPSGKIPFHDIRKKVKKIQYLLLLFADWSTDTSFLSTDDMERVETLQTALGDWHDREVLLQQLSGFGIVASHEVVKELKKDLLKREDEILKMINVLQ